MSAFYSSTETAFACLNKFEFKVRADEGEKRAKLIVKLYDHFDTTLISVLIGNNAVAILISMLSTSLFLFFFHNSIEEFYVSLIASITMAILTFFFGDTLPKLIAKKIPEKIVNLNVYPMTFFVIVFYPITLLFKVFSFLFRKVFKTKVNPEITEKDIVFSVEEKEEKGELEENESDLIVASLDFDDTLVKEVLTPKKRMSMLDVNVTNNSTLVEFLKNCPYTSL